MFGHLEEDVQGLPLGYITPDRSQRGGEEMGKTWRQLTTCPADQLTLLVDVLVCGVANPFMSLPESPLQSRILAEEQLIPSRPKKKRTLLATFVWL